MHTGRRGEAEDLAAFDDSEVQLLGAGEERTLLRDLAECKAKLAQALAEVPEFQLPEDSDDPEAMARAVTGFYTNDGPAEARLGAIHRRYGELRSRLALANMRLVAHVAKRFRNRGVAYSDLIQEGFCGLLEAIDRFDLTHETKLATYASWWIRQAMQRAVAGGAYPVRLSPRHLRQLAQNQAELDGGELRPEDAVPTAGASAEMIRRINAATRPAVSLNASFDGDSAFGLLQTMSDPDADATDAVETDEAIGRLMETLRPREREVLALRFGLRGTEKLSLSQVGKEMAVSKERVRQIQDRALEKLRAAAIERKVGLPDFGP